MTIYPYKTLPNIIHSGHILGRVKRDNKRGCWRLWIESGKVDFVRNLFANDLRFSRDEIGFSFGDKESAETAIRYAATEFAKLPRHLYA
jgi:hypothetical protein